MDMSTLYELTESLAELQEMLEQGEYDEQALNDTIEAVDLAFEDKADGYAMIIRNMQGAVDVLKGEEKRLADRRKTFEAGIKRLKDTLQASMIAADKRKFKTDLFSFGIQKNGGALPVVVDVETDALPDELVQIVEKPDLKAIAAYIESTGDLSYAHFGERGESLRIR